jgi:hypothetical protein
MVPLQSATPCSTCACGELRSYLERQAKKANMEKKITTQVITISFLRMMARTWDSGDIVKMLVFL